MKVPLPNVFILFLASITFASRISRRGGAPIDNANWGGAGLSGGHFTSVTGTFKLPQAVGPDGATGSVWVGIDGTPSCSVNALAQTGIQWTVGEFRNSYFVWYEWFPQPPDYMPPIDVKAGDTIRLTLHVKNAGSATSVIENLTNGQKVTKDFGASSGGSQNLCMGTAEWIVESLTNGNTQVPLVFADFGTLEFYDASAVKDGKRVGTGGATVYNIVYPGSQVLFTLCSVPSGSTVQCKYKR